jgi:Flp pilus assembly protein TadG
MIRVRDERGQAAVLCVLFIATLLGLSALVLDVGTWFRGSRASQAAADAAALAGAQALPAAPATAKTLALQYANSKNGGGLTSGDIAVTSSLIANDTISVTVHRTAPGFFSRLLGVTSTSLGAHATARVSGLQQAQYVAPIAVDQADPLISGPGCVCFNKSTSIPLGKVGVPGGFHLLNLDQSKGGTSPKTLADWMLNGFQNALPLGGYFSDPGAKWNSSQIQNALTSRIGSDLLFPVYDKIVGNGANAQYHIVAWIGFYLTGVDARGSSGDLFGYFDSIIWEGLPAQTAGGGGPNYGVYAVQLIG